MIILLIDDDEDDRKLFAESAKDVDEKISCIEAPNAQDALKYLRDTNHPLPQFIFLDLRMPGLSGQQCLLEIKKDPRLKSIPVIVYTTSRDIKESVRLKEMGAAHFMSKPVSPDDVYYLISFVLSQKWE